MEKTFTIKTVKSLPEDWRRITGGLAENSRRIGGGLAEDLACMEKSK
jgi:hypothetical protein